jgi:hypothetical protein
MPNALTRIVISSTSGMISAMLLMFRRRKALISGLRIPLSKVNANSPTGS